MGQRSSPGAGRRLGRLTCLPFGSEPPIQKHATWQICEQSHHSMFSDIIVQMGNSDLKILV